jgi:integrase
MPGTPPQLGPCKTESSVRTIPVPQVVLDALALHIAEYGLHADGFIFPTDGKGDPIRRSALGHLWRRAAVKVEVEGFTPHDPRHYAASVLIDQGASVKVVQRHLGHGSATTTLDTYAHL